MNKKLYKTIRNKNLMKKLLLLNLLFGSALLFMPISVQAQCPNLDFSMGDFTNWQTYHNECQTADNNQQVER